MFCALRLNALKATIDLDDKKNHTPFLSKIFSSPDKQNIKARETPTSEMF